MRGRAQFQVGPIGGVNVPDVGRLGGGAVGRRREGLKGLNVSEEGA